ACSHRGVCSQRELARQQMLHAIVIHDQHDQVDGLGADLKSEAASRHHEKCRRAPPLRRPATGQTPPVLGSHDNPPFSIDGTTATHPAEPSISCGIPESGADSISFRTSAAACARSVAFDSFAGSSAPKEKEQSDRITAINTSFFMFPRHTEISLGSS